MDLYLNFMDYAPIIRALYLEDCTEIKRDRIYPNDLLFFVRS